MSASFRLLIESQGAQVVVRDLRAVGDAGQQMGARLASAGTAAEGGMGRARAGVASISQQLQQLRTIAIGALSVGFARELVRDVAQATMALDRMDRGLQFASANAAELRTNTRFLRETVDTLGLDLGSAGDAFVKLAAAARGTALQGAGARSVFDAVSRASTVMGLNAGQAAGALTAVEQMISKGTVSAEELRGQLGERLPGAFQIAARSMGLTTQQLGKLLEQGSLATDVFLPRFAAQLRTEVAASVAQAADSIQANLNRVQTEWLRMKSALLDSRAVSDTLAGVADGMRAIGTVMQSSSTSWPGWASAATQSLAFVAEAANLVWSSIRGVRREFQGLFDSANLYLERQAALMAAGSGMGGKGTTTAQIRAEFDARQRALNDGYNRDIAEIYKYLGKFKKAADDEVQARQDRLAALANADPRDVRARPDYQQQVADQILLADKKGLAESLAAASAKKSAYESVRQSVANLADRIARKVAEERAELESGRKLTAAQEAYIQVMSLVRDGKLRLADIERDGTLATLQQAMADAEGNRQRQQAAELSKEVAAQTKRLTEERTSAMASEAAAGERELQQMRDRLVEVTQGREALEALVTSRLEDTAATHEQIAAGMAHEAMNEQEIEHRRTLARQLREIVDLRRQAASATASKEAEAANAQAAKAAADDWQRAADQIGQSLADALMQGGKSAAEYIKGLFRTMVLRPIIQAVTQPAANAVLGALGMGAAGPAAAGQGGVSALGSLGSLGASLGAFGGAFGTGLAYGGASGLIGGLQGAGALLGAGNIGMGLGAAAGALGPYALAAAAAYAIYKQLDKSGTHHKGSVVGVDAAGAASTLWGDPSQITRHRDAQTDSALSALGQSAAGMLNALSRASGGVGGYTSVLKYASDNTDPSIGGFNLSRGGQTLSDFGVYQGDFRKYDKDAQAGFEQYTRDVVAATRGALDQIDLPNWAREQFRGLEEGADLQALAGVADSVAQTMQALRGMESGLRDLGGVFATLAGQGSDALYQVAQMAGGMDALASSTGAYYAAFYDDTKRAERSTQVMTEALAEVGLALPASRDAFREVVDGLNVTTEAGRRQFVVMMQLAGSFDEVAKVAEAAALETQRAAEAEAQEAQRLAEESLARAQAVASEREQLEDRLLQAMGNTAELRARELARLDASNRALQERVWALDDEQQHLQALAGAGQGIAAFVRELLGVGRSASASLAEARREYLADLGLAQRGDVDASSRITGSARDFVDALRANSTDPVSFARETSRIATQLQALPATVAWQQQVLDNLAQVASHTGAGGALAIAIGSAMAEVRATITLTLDSALPEDLKQLALGITATVTRTVQFVADATQLPADLRTLAAQTSSALLVTVQAALAADMPNDVRELTLRTQHTLAVTVNAALAANVPDDVKRLALRATHELVTTVAAALSPTLPDDVRSLALRTQSTLAVTVQAALAADVSDDVKRLALSSLSSHAVTVGAVLAADIDADAKRLALQASNAYLVTVNALLASTIPDDVKTVLLNASTTATRAVQLSATLSEALTADQRAVLHASSETIRRIIEQVVNSPALTPEQWALLDAVPATVRRVIEQVLQSPTLTDEQRALLQAITGDVRTSLDIIVRSGESITWDASDPLKSIFLGIKAAAENTAGLLTKASNGTLGFYVSLARAQNADGALDIGANIIRAWSLWGGPHPKVQVSATAYAAGGAHPGGIRLVGEQGPELEVTGAARIYSAEQTQRMLAGGMREPQSMLAELRELRREVAGLRAEQAAGLGAGVAASNKVVSILDRVTDGGSAMITTAA